MIGSLRSVKHLVRAGLARTRNPYRSGDVTHPSSFHAPESGRDMTDKDNLHSSGPKHAHQR